MTAHDPLECVRCRVLAASAFKVCGCGRPYTRAGWDRLPFVGVQDDGVERIELRNCVCGSTIAVALGMSARSA
jgi:hypothetical protein